MYCEGTEREREREKVQEEDVQLLIESVGTTRNEAVFALKVNYHDAVLLQ